MMYPCFTQAFKLISAVNYMVTYTTKEKITKYHRLRMLHENILVVFSYFCMALHTLSTFLLAIKDKTEFLERLVEDIIVIHLILDFYIVRRNLSELIQLVNEMKTKFSTADPSIVKKCVRAEELYYWTITSIGAAGLYLSVFEVILVPSEDRILAKAALYHYKNSHRGVPCNIFIPTFVPIDLSEEPFYSGFLILLVFEVTYCLLTAAMTVTIMGTFALHIEGQFEMLLNRTKLISEQELDTRGNRKFYTNIITGEYFTQPPNTNSIIYTRRVKSADFEADVPLSERNIEVIRLILSAFGPKGARQGYFKSFYRRSASNTRRCDGKQVSDTPCIEAYSNIEAIQGVGGSVGMEHNDAYDEFLLKQIIQYNQFLLYFRKKVQDFLQPISIPTCVNFILLVALFYQNLVFSSYKLVSTIGALICNLQLFAMVEFSNNIDRVKNKFNQQLFYETNWYRMNLRCQKLVSFAIQRCNQPEHFAFYAGLVTYDRTLILTLFSRSYKILNWLIYMNFKNNVSK